MKKLVVVVTVLLSIIGHAEEVSPEKASLAVRSWMKRGLRPMNARFKSGNTLGTRSFTNEVGQTLFHVVGMQGGGFVVTSGDTMINPIIAFSDSGEFDASEDSPLYAILIGDMGKRIKAYQSASARKKGSISNGRSVEASETAWARLTEVPDEENEASINGVPQLPTSNLAELPDVRVDPIVKSQWSQSGKWGGNNVYNYYTPSNVNCGCTATAVAQVMRYWEYPSNSLPKVTYTCQFNGMTTNMTTKGGIYDWKNMPLSKNDIESVDQCKQIGKLCYDVAVAAGMKWTKNSASSNGSGAAGFNMIRQNLIDYFGYASSEVIFNGGITGTLENMPVYSSYVLGSLNAGMPVVGAIKDCADGITAKYAHTVILDGYGYADGVMFCHVNFGWGGDSAYNVWYNLFSETIEKNGTYDYLYWLIANIHPTESGSVISGRTVDSTGKPFSGAVVRVRHVSSGVYVDAQSDSHGIWHIRTSRTGGFEVQVVSSLTSSVSSEISEVSLSSGNLWNVDLVVSQEMPSPTYIVTVNPNNGILVGSNFGNKEGTGQQASVKVTYGSINYWNLGTATRTGYAFDGWWTDANGGNQVYDSAGKAITGSLYWDTKWQWIYQGDVSVYAHWTPIGPDNDSFSSATPIYNSFGSMSGSNVGATMEKSEPIPSAQSSSTGSIWYKWTAPYSGTVTFDTIGTGFDTVLGVYTGTTVSSLTEIESDDDDGGNLTSKLSFEAVSGTTYRIAVYGYNGKTGSITLNWSLSSAPATVTVTFNSNGGKFSNGAATKTVEATPGNLWGKMPMPALSGQVFDGYYTAKEGGDLVTASSQVPNGSATYYAHWTPRLGLAAASEWSGEFTTDSWCGQGTVSHDGRDALRSGIIYDNQGSYLITKVTGSGVLSFWWAVSCEAGGKDALRLLVDGAQVQMISGDVDWTKVEVPITGSGTHVIKWNYTKNGSVTKGEDFGWIDQIGWTASTVEEAFVFDANGGKFSNGATVKKTDATPGNLWGKMYMPAKDGQVFVGWYTAKEGGDLVTSSSTVPYNYCTYYAHWTPRLGLAAASEWGREFTTDSWCGQGAVSHDGKDALRSGIIYDKQNSYLQTRVTGEGTLTFWWKVSCEGGGNDALRLLVDGSQVKMISGETDWTQVTVPITGSGTHVVKWNYTKNGSVTKGQDFGWLDQIIWTDGDTLTHDKVQLWEGGPYWATTNIGAEKPEDYGYYFWWGDTVGYKRVNDKWVATDGSSSNFSFSSDNTPTYGKDIATLQSEGWITADNVLAPAHDAAHVQWGGNWRMPTGQELSDLNSKCDWTWTTVNGVNGYVMRGRGDYSSASIFLPGAG